MYIYTQCFKKPGPLQYFGITSPKQTGFTRFFGRDDHYSFIWQLWVKTLIQAENHLHGFHTNGVIIAGQCIG